MGRAKLKMQLIEKEKSRILTLKKRKEGLTKKLHELTTLCDISACTIIYDPAHNSSSIWPRNSDDQVRRLIDGYKAKTKDFCSGGVKSYGLPEFFNDRQKEIEGELVKLRKKNLEAKFPTWDERLCLLDASQLRELGAALRCNAQNVRSRIQSLKQQESEIMKNNMMMAYKYNYNYNSNLGGQFYDPATAFDVMPNNFAAAQNIPMNMIGSSQNCYPALPPLPPPAPPQAYTAWPANVQYYSYSSMNQNLNYNNNWCGDDDGGGGGGDITWLYMH